MLKPEIGLEKIVIITKELGTIVFTTKYRWENFKFGDITLHSFDKPAFQEYYERGSSRFVWFKDGKHHRPDGPAIYNYSNNFNANHVFDLTPRKSQFSTAYYNFNENNALNIYFYLNGVSYGKNLTNKYLHDAKKYLRRNKLINIFENSDD